MPAESIRLDLIEGQSDSAQETSLVRRAQAGDFRAYEELYRLHVDRVFALCLRMVANRSWAEELTQDAFVRVWEMIGSFRGDSLFSSWLHRVAVNTVLVAMRSKRRMLARVFSTPDLHVFDVEMHESQPGRRMDIEQAIAGLPPQARVIFVLHDVEGYRHEEIAEQMGLAVGTSKAQLHRARRILREVLEQ
jgi:RNA polymerase sigma-70 factor (ECF subfamily)